MANREANAAQPNAEADTAMVDDSPEAVAARKAKENL